MLNLHHHMTCYTLQGPNDTEMLLLNQLFRFYNFSKFKKKRTYMDEAIIFLCMPNMKSAIRDIQLIANSK